MGLWGALKGIGKIAAPIAASMIPGVGAFAGPMVAAAMNKMGQPKQQQPGRGINPSAGMMQGRGMAQGRQQQFQPNMPHAGMGMDQMITQGRNSVNPSWMYGGPPTQPFAPPQGQPAPPTGGGFGGFRNMAQGMGQMGGPQQQGMGRPIQNMMQKRQQMY
jgi:hypothetical protein